MEEKTKEPFSIGKRNLNHENHWEPLNIETYRITKPTVICLGGNGTTEEKDANPCANEHNILLE